MSLEIVLIEDEKDVVDFVSYFLQKEGYQVFSFLRGEDFLEKMDTLLPDVIILDLMLPGIDGLEVFRYVREYPRFRNVPIIMLTAK
ncbi:MAG TPA: response regulator, partial [Candidatus Atribacteria bacterium]|nr:response regulator [Candidatus Atribacteria bacterium]